ncbi:MAG: DUF2752 domain-containing protein [bacterium]
MTEPVNSRALTACRLAVGFALAVLAILPQEMASAGPQICLFKNLLGIECFGCGMTRAIAAALHGNFDAALALNPLVAAALPILIAFVVFPVARWHIFRRRRGLVPCTPGEDCAA